MPTARELLEQAEALMRRNRSGRVDTEDVAPAVTVADVAPAPPPIEVHAPEPAAEPLGPEPEALPAGSPAAVPAAQAEGLPPRDEVPVLQDAAVAADDVPVLQDAEPAPDEAPVLQGAAPPVPAAEVSSLDDIPVLTDVVEEIEAPTILEAPWDEGEASDWGEFDIIEEIEAPSIVDLPEEGGEPSGWGAYDGDTTLGGRAPDSLVVVPPVTYFRDEDARRGTALGAKAMAAAEQRPEATGESGVLVVDESMVHAGLLATEGAGEPLVAAVTSPASPEAPATPDLAEAGLEAAARAADAQAGTASYEVVPLGDAELITATVVTPSGPADVPLVAAEPAPVPVPGELAAPVMPDSAQWQALAEEIRMQVLQRIDMFTDAGMQDQLRARLQPIVDRASADLVSAINQHVGQLLRGYVAEAIEREIDKWRGGR
jgi:hypothetical protein